MKEFTIPNLCHMVVAMATARGINIAWMTFISIK